MVFHDEEPRDFQNPWVLALDSGLSALDFPMPRFVILEHDHPFLHWDLMLEWGESLRTWRLDREPVVPEAVAAEPLPDHRLAYLDYEGPVSGNRGAVKRWDSGSYRLVEETAGRVTIELRGGRLSGTAVISVDDPDGCRFVLTGIARSVVDG